MLDPAIEMRSKVYEAVDPLMAPLRDGIIPAADYISREYLNLENKYLWPNIWQVVCREEELAGIGDYLTFDIVNDSVILVRLSESEIGAYHNVCPHRGRQLMDGCGNARTFRCGFHGWKWDIQGNAIDVLDRDGWNGSLKDEDIKLKRVKVETWGGFVFVNLSSKAEPLAEYLSPLPEYFGHFEYARMRYMQCRTFKLPCNWKVVLEAFNEAYHVAGTHPQLIKFYDDKTATRSYGKHAMVAPADNSTGMRALGQPRSGASDARQLIVGFYKHLHAEFGATYTQRDTEAAHRLLAEMRADAPPADVNRRFVEIRREAALAVGAGWPEVTSDQLKKGGLIWQLFPNLIINATFNAAVVYRARPHVSDPDSCTFDVWSLQRFAPGAEPKLKREVYDNYSDCPDLGLILNQDFSNIAYVQKGMKSRGFAGARPSPAQESTVINFHKVIREYVNKGMANL